MFDTTIQAIEFLPTALLLQPHLVVYIARNDHDTISLVPYRGSPTIPIDSIRLISYIAVAFTVVYAAS